MYRQNLLGGQTSDLSGGGVGVHDEPDQVLADSEPAKVGSTSGGDSLSGVVNGRLVASLGRAELDEVVVDVGNDARVGVVEDCIERHEVSYG